MKFGFFSLETQTESPVFVCTRTCVLERKRARIPMIEYGVSCLRCCKKMLNSDKTTKFAHFGDTPLSESAASESASSSIWKMNCMGSFQALIPNKFGPGRAKMSYAICQQQRCRSACTSAQSDQHLCCSLLRQYDMYTCYIQSFKILASFCS